MGPMRSASAINAVPADDMDATGDDTSGRMLTGRLSEYVGGSCDRPQRLANPCVNRVPVLEGNIAQDNTIQACQEYLLQLTLKHAVQAAGAKWLIQQLAAG